MEGLHLREYGNIICLIAKLLSSKRRKFSRSFMYTIASFYDLLLIALATYQIGRETWAIDILQHPGHTMDNITKSSGSVKWNWITKIDTEFNRRNSTSLFKQQKLFTI